MVKVGIVLSVRVWFLSINTAEGSGWYYQVSLTTSNRISIYKVITRTFIASCYSARLSWALVLTWVSPFVQDKKLGFGLGEE